LRDEAELRAAHAKHMAQYPWQRRIVVDLYRTIRPIHIEQEGHVPAPLGTWEEALSDSARTRRCAGAASRDCTALWWIGIFGHERKREANRRSSLRTVHKIRDEYLDYLADDLKITITANIRLSKRYPIGIA
jgi:hypothetical protein